eukprot:Awhi_evm1s1141
MSNNDTLEAHIVRHGKSSRSIMNLKTNAPITSTQAKRTRKNVNCSMLAHRP